MDREVQLEAAARYALRWFKDDQFPEAPMLTGPYGHRYTNWSWIATDIRKKLEAALAGRADAR